MHPRFCLPAEGGATPTPAPIPGSPKSPQSCLKGFGGKIAPRAPFVGTMSAAADDAPAARPPLRRSSPASKPLSPLSLRAVSPVPTTPHASAADTAAPVSPHAAAAGSGAVTAAVIPGPARVVGMRWQHDGAALAVPMADGGNSATGASLAATATLDVCRQYLTQLYAKGTASQQVQQVQQAQHALQVARSLSAGSFGAMAGSGASMSGASRGTSYPPPQLAGVAAAPSTSGGDADMADDDMACGSADMAEAEDGMGRVFHGLLEEPVRGCCCGCGCVGMCRCEGPLLLPPLLLPP